MDDRIDANFAQTFPDDAFAKRSGNENNLSWKWKDGLLCRQGKSDFKINFSFTFSDEIVSKVPVFHRSHVLLCFTFSCVRCVLIKEEWSVGTSDQTLLFCSVERRQPGPQIK